MEHPVQSAVLVIVPVAEPVVGVFRTNLDQAAGWGVPAHVTVLFPFLPPEQIDAEVLSRLAAAVAEVPEFDARWVRTAWFDQEVLWVAPEPAEPFRALTAAVFRAFPAYPPFEGRHPDVVPHLTVGHAAPVADLLAAEQAIQPQLPFSMPVTEVHLMAGSPAEGAWHKLARLPLG